MNIQELTSKFIQAQSSISEINRNLLAGSQKVRIERIYDELQNIWVEIEAMKPEVKNLTIANYKL